MKFEILNGSEGKMRERERGEKGGRKEWIRKGWMGKGDMWQYGIMLIGKSK